MSAFDDINRLYNNGASSANTPKSSAVLDTALDSALLHRLLSISGQEELEYLFECARSRTEQIFGRAVYIRGLVEFTSYCRCDCYYCGLRKSNKEAVRFRMSKEEILQACRRGYELGFRTFVLQGGEDEAYTAEAVSDIVREIKSNFNDCAVTLSLGEHDAEIYRMWRDAGADRYLLRHETADERHFTKLHPPKQRLETRIECLMTLMKLGFQTGAGFMVGSPYQTTENIVQDLLFIAKLKPHMVGVGPFIPHSATPMAHYAAGSVEMTLKVYAILRGLLPDCLIPATTALVTLDKKGRTRGIQAGANVIMPNLSPTDARQGYLLYDGKATADKEAEQQLAELKAEMNAIGREVVVGAGHSPRAIEGRI